jgi:hypothetical protein
VQPARGYQQLKATSGGDVVTVDPTTGGAASFRLDNIPIKVGRYWCYVEKIRIWLETVFDQAASGGAVVPPDQFYRLFSNFRLQSDDLGILYGPGDITGPQMGLIAQVVGGGYKFPFILREDLGAADGDTSLIVPLEIPIAHGCFYKGHQTGVWAGWFRAGGILDVNLAVSTALAGVSTGAALKAPTKVRAEVVYTVEPEARLPELWHWRVHQTPGADTKHVIPNVGQGAGIKGSQGGGKIAFLAYLSNLAGLGGAGAISNIQRVYPRDRDQQTHDHGTPFWGTASYLQDFVTDTKVKNIFPPAQGQAYPYQLGTKINGAPNAATALFLPYIWPDPAGQEVSKLQEWTNNYYIEHNYAATPAGQAQWLILANSYLDPSHEAYLQSRMGLPPGAFVAYPKVRGLHSAGDPAGQAEQAKKLRGIPRKLRAR